MATPTHRGLFEAFDPLDYLQPRCACPGASDLVRQVRLLVFDDYLTSSVLTFTATTSDAYSRVLAVFDQLAIEVVADNFANVTVSCSVSLLHSGDGESWLTKATLISSATLGAAQTTVLPVAYDDGSVPTLGFARLSISVTQDGTKHVRLRVTASLFDNRWRDLADLDPGSAAVIQAVQRGDASPLGRRRVEERHPAASLAVPSSKPRPNPPGGM